MKFREFGNSAQPTIILLHGGGLSWWAFEKAISFLKTDYHVAAAIIDGHGEDADTDFISVQDSAQKLIRYIDEKQGGSVYALAGFSLGAQIAVEALSLRPDIARNAIIESVSVVPAPHLPSRHIYLFAHFFYGLNHAKPFLRLRAKFLCLPCGLFERYYMDSRKISKTTYERIAGSNAMYVPPGTLGATMAKVLIILGSKEIKRLDLSVRKLLQTIPGARVCILPGMRQGAFSMAHAKEYASLLRRMLA